MGKKKSVVLMTLLTIVIVVLCAITAFPSFTIPFTNGIKKWNPAVMQFDLGMDLGGEYLDGYVGGGYYAYYYPDGVIPASEYEADEHEEGDYVAHEGLYLSTDPDKRIYLEDGKTVNTDFQAELDGAVKAITARYAAKGYEDFRVAVVDDYAIRVELPNSQGSDGVTSASSASQALTLFALTGELNFQKGGELVDELTDEENEYTIRDLLKEVKLGTQTGAVYLEFKLTSVGETMLETYQSEAASDSSTSLDLAIGDEVLISITTTNQNILIDGDSVKYFVANKEDKHYAQTLYVLLDSALNDGSFDVEFTVSEVRSFSNNTLYVVFGILLAVIVALIVVAIVKMGRFGVVNMYATLSYFIITALCFAFISRGVFVVSLGTVLVFLMGLALVNACSYKVYKAIKAEAALGKTIESSTKAGYKKNLMFTVDLYAVLGLGAIALLIGAGGLATVAAQALIVVVTGAFISLLWSRVINYVFLSASKDKYSYFKLVREDDDDE
ncbi:MAG: hypothetical protein IJ393_02140 [Clostridia bacterium]|nr:hypothetical protein [Clostridia bacterium]